MEEMGTVIAHAASDADDRLIAADEPLASLHINCGGELPGVIAVPELLELVRRARMSRFCTARTVFAQDGQDAISAWIDVEPTGDGEGCAIRVRSWHASPVVQEDGAVAERRLIVDRHLAEMFAYLGPAQQIIAVSAVTSELQPVAASMSEGTGKTWTEFLAPANVIHQQPLHWRLLDGSKVLVPGSQRDWRVSLIPQIVPGSEPVGFELLLIADRPATPNAPEAMPISLPPRRDLVGRDLAPVLKQPIARIIANAETIRTRLAGPLPEAYAEYAGEIASAGTLLLGLLEDMADLELVESEHFSTTPDPVDLSEVARQAAGILSVRARDKNITVDQPTSEQTMPALAEFRRVLQILLNLIGNAIRYSPESSRIAITLDLVGERARIHVSDEGPGMTEEEQAKVFDKFERLGRSGDGGSGLGLYISRSLARAMGGDLTVHNAAGFGTRFTLEVPADPDS